MKKSAFVLCAILCVGIANSSHAQPTQPATHEAALVVSKRDFKAENYEAATTDAKELLAVAASLQEVGEARMLLGETYYRRKMFDEAGAQWAKILELRDTGDDESLQTFAHLGYARSYAAQGQFDKAIPEYKSVIESFEAQAKADGDDKNPDTKTTLAPFTLALADAYYHTKQYDLAQQQLSQIIQFSEGDSVFRLLALIKAGEIDLLERKFGDAADKWKRALAMDSAPASSTKGGIQELIPLLENLDKQQVGAGQANDGKPKISVESPKEIAEAISAIVAGIMDTLVGEGFIESLGE